MVSLSVALARQNGNWKPGHRTVGGKRIFFRSRWEANYARYLEWLKKQKQLKEWEYEPVTFWFEKIRRGVTSYKPDFRITENNGSQCFHEVKGWMDAKSKTKLRRMEKYHPEVKLVLIDKKTFGHIARGIEPLIDDWE